MQHAIKVQVDVSEDHVIKLPPEVPVGPAEVIVLIPPPATKATRPVGIDAGKGFSVPDDFDEPLPPEIQQAFEGISSS
jgi:hypothetical protein